MTSASRYYPVFLLGIWLLTLFAAPVGRADPGAEPATDSTSAAKATALVNAAINMTDSEKAVKLLWQATEIDPTLQQPYIYLGLYYNSRSDFANVIKVYQKMVKYRPKEVSAYLNIGEAYMSFSPPRMNSALGYYQKAYRIDSTSAFAALRIGEILAHQGNRDDAIRYLRQASSAGAKSPTIAAEAQKVLNQIGAS